MKKSLFLVYAVGLTLVFASCASKKSMQTDAPIDKPMVTTVDYLKKIIDNGVSAKNIVTDMTFNIKIGSKDISVPGSLRMRRDEVIRLQLFVPLLGTEVGRIEFSPDRVLIVNRLHKEYIEADYTQLDFLKNNDLNFYSLQALFWNQLAVPGKNGVDISDFDQFNVDGTNVKLTRGNMTYNWTTAASGQIVMTNISYASASSGASSLLWMYSNFRPLGVGQFPLHQDFQFTTTATKKLKTVKVAIDMENVKDKADWDTKTTVSSKYKKVSPSDILGKLLSF